MSEVGSGSEVGFLDDDDGLAGAVEAAEDGGGVAGPGGAVGGEEVGAGGGLIDLAGGEAAAVVGGVVGIERNFAGAEGGGGEHGREAVGARVEGDPAAEEQGERGLGGAARFGQERGGVVAEARLVERPLDVIADPTPGGEV